MLSHDSPFLKLNADEFRFSHQDIPAPAGWEPPENFPECCEFHKGAVNGTKNFLEKFPFCCDSHKEFAERFPPLKGEYDYLITKVVNQISYTEFIIADRLNNDDWFEDITDYLEYNISSFGHPGMGDHLYYIDIKHYIKNSTSEIPQEKRDKLIGWLEEKWHPKVIHQSADLNTLHRIHQKWIKTFPFELSYFAPLKEHFSKKKPFVSKIVRTNRYTGLTAFQVHTEESMVQYLFDLTKNLLNAINTKELVQSGKIANVDQPKFEMILQEREVKRKALLESYDKKERRYINTIKQWLKDEIDFFSQLKSLDNKILPKPRKENKPSKNLSFKLKHGKADKVKSIIYDLNREFYLLNEDKCNCDDFIEVLLSKQVVKKTEIHFNCYNNQLAFIIDEFKNRKYFDGLSYASIEKAGFFFSKEGTKITGQLISSSKNQNPKPEGEAEIVAIFNKFQ
jgi:hypothetical protein